MEWAKIENYILEKYPISQTWEPKKLSDWIRWAESENYLFLILDSEPWQTPHLCGLAVARPVADPMKIPTDHPTDDHDPKGDTVFVDLAISDGKPMLKMLCLTIWDRFRDKPNVAFNRYGRKTKVKIYQFMHIRKTLLRKERK